MEYRGLVVVVLSLQLSVAFQFHNFTRGTCREHYLTCAGGQSWRSSVTTSVCFHEKHLCDNETDCSDSSDERYCPGHFNYGQEGSSFRFIQGPCPFDFVLCKSGTQAHTTGLSDKRCIKKSMLCDGVKSCFDGSDERYCPYDIYEGFNFRLVQEDCPQGYYKCRTGSPINPPTSIDNKECISKSWICNENTDCKDGSDEKFCPYFFPEDLIYTESLETVRGHDGYQEVLNIIAKSEAMVVASFAIAVTNTAIVLATAGYYFWTCRARAKMLTSLEGHKLLDRKKLNNLS